VSADHVPKENMNEYVGSSWLHKRECLNIVFWSNIGKRLNLKRSALRRLYDSWCSGISPGLW